MRARQVIFLVASAVLVTGNLAAVAGASAAQAAVAARSPAAISLPAPVSQTAVSYTPNLYAGTTCGTACNPSTVFSTVVVNGEVVVAGAFTQACTPAATGFAQCPTTTPTDMIMAFDPATGAIDPNFTPVFDQGPVNTLAVGPGNTVYAGGAFTTVNGSPQQGLVQLNVTPGQPGDGQVVSGFTGQTNGTVNNLAFNGSALYVGGVFSAVDGTTARGVARVNATTGALDSSFGITLGSPTQGAGIGVQAMSVNPSGSLLAIGGSFQTVNGQSIPRLALINTGGGLGSAATPANWTSPLLANTCFKQHNYVNAIDFSPDGSFFAVDTTGFKTAGGPAICDAVARFETGGTGTNIQPTWVNYTGGDSMHSIAITGNVVYAGGHNRWMNDECGDNRWCEANAVLVNGLEAVDASTGVGLAWWHPGTARGVGVSSLTPFPAGTFAGSDGGLLVGTDVNNIGGASHSELAMFPMTTTTAPVPGGPVQSGMFSQGRLGGSESTTNGVAAMCVDEAGNSTVSGTKVQLSTCNNSLEQNWTIQPDKTIQINGLCLDTKNGAITAGTLVVADTCTGGTSQQWVPGTGSTLVNQASNLCLNDPKGSTVNPTQLQIHACGSLASENWPMPVAQAPPPPPSVGPVFSQLVQKNTQVPCLTDTQGKTAPGTPVELSTCLMSPVQNWTIESDGTIRIKDRCMDTSSPGGGAGSLIVLNPCNGASSQIWTVGPTSSLLDQASGLCLSDPGSNAANGIQLNIETCTGGKYQQWHLPAV